MQPKTPTRYTVKFWAGPFDGKIRYEETFPVKDYYLTVQGSEVVKTIVPDMEFHHYELTIISSHVTEYKYKGIVTK